MASFIQTTDYFTPLRGALATFRGTGAGDIDSHVLYEVRPDGKLLTGTGNPKYVFTPVNDPAI